MGGRSLSEHGHYVRYGVDSDGFRHVFCGTPVVSGADCPNCDRPLLQLLALDSADARLELAAWRHPWIPLLFCWRCNVAQQPFVYRVEGAAIALLNFGRQGVESDFPYESYPIAFPAAAVRLEPVPAEHVAIVAGWNRGDDMDWNSPEHTSLVDPRHQIGGRPRLVQGEDRAIPRCPACRRPMRLLATIADDCLDPRGFTGNCGVQVIYHCCADCSILHCTQECD